MMQNNAISLHSRIKNFFILNLSRIFRTFARNYFRKKMTGYG